MSAKGFWDNKKVLVTGFEGFLGSHLTKGLVSRGAKVLGLDIKVRRKETVLNLQDYKRIKVIKGDVSDYKLLRDIIGKNKIEIVFHLAAEALVARGHETPLRTFRSNICGTWSLLEACRIVGSIEAIVVASSDKAYGAHKNLPYRECYPLMGTHPYDVSKSCADLITNAYFCSYKLPVVITRCGNIYGPGDFNFSRLVPDAMRCFSLNKTLQVRSDGKFVRDYVYVDDIVGAYIRIAEILKQRRLSGEAFNLSGQRPITVLQLIDKVNKLRIKNKKLEYEILDRAKYEIKSQYLSSQKARRILGWKARYSLEEGLKNTAEWYFNYFNKR